MSNYFQRVAAQTPTGFWINNVTQEEAHKALNAGATGCTQNPSYPWKMLNHAEASSHARQLLADAMKAHDDDNMAQLALQRSLVKEIAEIFLPQYEASGGTQGFVSIQGDPFNEDTECILRFARYNREAGVNIMAKVPATPDGLKAIEVLLKEGTPINATEVMSVRQALDVCDVYARATQGMKNPPVIYLSHIAGIFDEYIAAEAAKIGADIPSDYLWQAGIAVAKKIDQMVRETGAPMGFISGGARGLQHFTEMVGCKCVVTINWLGMADALLEQSPPIVQRFLQPTPHSVLDALCEKLPDFRKAYEVNALLPEEYEDYGPVALFRHSFEDAWQSTLKLIKDLR